MTDAQKLKKSVFFSTKNPRKTWITLHAYLVIKPYFTKKEPLCKIYIHCDSVIKYYLWHSFAWVFGPKWQYKAMRKNLWSVYGIYGRKCAMFLKTLRHLLKYNIWSHGMIMELFQSRKSEDSLFHQQLTKDLFWWKRNICKYNTSFSTESFRARVISFYKLPNVQMLKLMDWFEVTCYQYFQKAWWRKV